MLERRMRSEESEDMYVEAHARGRCREAEIDKVLEGGILSALVSQRRAHYRGRRSAMKRLAGPKVLIFTLLLLLATGSACGGGSRFGTAGAPPADRPEDTVKVAEGLVRAIYSYDVEKVASFFHPFDQSKARQEFSRDDTGLGLLIAQARERGIRLTRIEGSRWEPWAPLFRAEGVMVTVRYFTTQAQCTAQVPFDIIDGKWYPSTNEFYTNVVVNCW